MAHIYTLVGSKVKNREDLYVELKKELNNPEFYGSNLDALWDVLSYTYDEITLHIENGQDLQNSLGEYFELFIGLLEDLQQQNKNFKYQIIS